MLVPAGNHLTASTVFLLFQYFDFLSCFFFSTQQFAYKNLKLGRPLTFFEQCENAVAIKFIDWCLVQPGVAGSRAEAVWREVRWYELLKRLTEDGQSPPGLVPVLEVGCDERGMVGF
jgi:hypothetical protein